MTDDLVKRPVLRIYTEATSDKGGIWAFKPYAFVHTVFVEESNYRDLEGHIEALTAQLAEDADARTQIDHRLEELVGQVDALTALVREADDLIGGDLTGLQWKRECRAFRVKARAALTGKETK